jgi:class 3 adenylate cyclase
MSIRTWLPNSRSRPKSSGTARTFTASPATIANGYDEVTVLFADIVNFTGMSADADPVDVVSFLYGLFSQFDDRR